MSPEEEIDLDRVFGSRKAAVIRAELSKGPSTGSIAEKDNVIADLKGQFSEMQEKPKQGLYGKYIISKADGSPVDPKADYFVLRIDRDVAAQLSMLEYARQTENKILAMDIVERLYLHNSVIFNYLTKSERVEINKRRFFEYVPDEGKPEEPEA